MEILSFEETKRLFGKYKVPFCETEIFNSKTKAIAFARKIGFPVVIKVHGRNIFHKSEIGGVKIGIKDEEEFDKAWEEMSANTEGKNVEGILVQGMGKGREIAMGMRRDKQFGPVLMFGLGGVFIEVLNDVSLRIAPITKEDAIGMIKEIRGYKILEGYREGKTANIQKLADVLVSLSKMSLKEENIEEIDLNPLMVDGDQIKLIDFRIII